MTRFQTVNILLSTSIICYDIDMRICIVNDYSLVHIGGAVTSLLEQKKSLESNGHTVFVLQLGQPVPDDKIDQSNFLFVKPTFTTPTAFYNLPFIFGTKKNYRKVKQLLIDNKIEVVHFQSEFSISYITMKVAKELNIPCVFTIHTFFWEFNGKFGHKLIAPLVRFMFESTIKQKIFFEPLTGNPVEQMLKNITLSLAKQSDAIISPSQHQLNTIQKSSIKTPAYVVPNPFIAPADSAPAKIIDSTEHPFRMVWIGRCAPEKRPIQFLQAITAASKQTSKKFYVDFIGSGGLLPTMQKDFQSDTIIFHGQQPHNKIVEYIDQSDIVVLSSYHFDNQPMIIAEGVTRFRPIFYCDERLTEGLQYAGYLTKDESVESMTAAIVSLVEDPKITYDLSLGAQKSSYIFSPETYSKTVIGIYSSIVK